jgi:hypothetical protein
VILSNFQKMDIFNVIIEIIIIINELLNSQRF